MNVSAKGNFDCSTIIKVVLINQQIHNFRMWMKGVNLFLDGSDKQTFKSLISEIN